MNRIKTLSLFFALVYLIQFYVLTLAYQHKHPHVHVQHRPNRFDSITSFSTHRYVPFHTHSTAFTVKNNSIPSSLASATSEMKLFNIRNASLLHVVQRLIDSITIDTNKSKPLFNSIVTCADRIKRLHKQHSSDQLASVCLKYVGVENYFNKRFDHYTIVQKPFKSKAIDLDSSPSPATLCSVRLQQNVQFGPKAIRFAFYQSLNKRNPLKTSTKSWLNTARPIWLTDNLMWLAVTLKPIGKVHTFNGWAILWQKAN